MQALLNIDSSIAYLIGFYICNSSNSVTNIFINIDVSLDSKEVTTKFYCIAWDSRRMHADSHVILSSSLIYSQSI